MRIYGVTSDTEHDMLLRLVRDGRQQGWWEPYTEGVQTARHVLDIPGRYAAMETEAVGYRGFTAMVLPGGLLQTAAYSRALLTALLPGHANQDIESLVQLRLQRQEALRRHTAPPLQMAAVLDEALFSRVVGGPALMAEQIDAIARTAALPNVDVRVLPPLSVGIHRAHIGQFTILQLRESLGQTVYIESHAGDTYLDSEEDTKLYAEVFDDVVAKSLSPRDSAALMAEYLHRYQSQRPERGGVMIEFSTSSFCNFGECVEVGLSPPDGTVLVRDSKDEGQTTLAFSRDEWVAFVKGVKAGEFDPPA